MTSERDARPVLFVTNHAPAFRVPAFTALHERENVLFALIGGALRHGGGGTGEALPFPAVHPPERTVARMAASGRYRAVVAGLSGRVALPSAYAGARAGRIPFVLWATIWRHPRTPAHALSYLPLRHIYRHADAVATYGPHVSAYVATKRSSGGVVVAPQSVDTAFWTTPGSPERHGEFQILYAGRLEREKGLDVLAAAWQGDGTLVLAGEGPLEIPGAISLGRCEPTDLRNLYAGSDVVVVPSVPTRDFLEPWGLVVNEAFHQGVAVIATDAVGAAAGGLVQHERTGLVVPAGDPGALGQALARLRADPALRRRLGAAGRVAAAAHTPAAWAEGMSRALSAARGKGC
jgi:glycosyltransferase involved in cell wall biosynthesis